MVVTLAARACRVYRERDRADISSPPVYDKDFTVAYVLTLQNDLERFSGNERGNE
jgi:hypothetical protein